ncbi:Esterase FE4 [Eumeta japonica]|uniref:Carboxylic ester hydrolase n=1 Tax=Eumeta variegata TaxID=151549 RepID=A0A4C1V343_EUMVA|nr:Esterase FE4 [Eumeta japonica]
MKLLKIISCFSLLLSYTNGVNVRVDPLVLTNQGLIRGQRASDGDYTAFLGIPYAQVDSSNPFGDSFPYPKFEEIYNAYNYTAECPQRGYNGDIIGDLECLSLNIFVPTKASYQNPLPILFWIHGGGFEGGSGVFNGVTNLVKHDVIVVSINYRLGPYGFMCLGTSKVPGNQGLKDQHTALQWVKDNIAAFGGNVNSITIAGQSAGAGSVDLHLHSSYEKLFHRAIMQSGSAKVEGMFVNGDFSAAINIANLLGFTTANTDDAISFLSTAPVRLVIAAASELNYWFRPCKEEKFDNIASFVEQDSQNLYNQQRIRNIPVLIGFTENEEYIRNIEQYVSTGDVFLSKLQKHFAIEDNDDLAHISKIVRHFYIGDEEMSIDSQLQLSDFESDFTFNHPIDRAIVKYLEQGAKVYQYVFAYSNDGSIASHGAELQYLSPKQLTNEKDSLVAERLSTMWTNFVKQGIPIPEPTVLLPVTWEQARSKDKRPYLHIDQDLTLKYRVYSQRMAFWNLFYDQYGAYNVLNTERMEEN